MSSLGGQTGVEIPATVLETLSHQLNSVAEDHGNQVHLEMEENLFDYEPQQQGPAGGAHTPNQAEHSPLAVIRPLIAKFGIFVLIILLKILYSHRYGMLMILSLVGLWYTANSTITQQIQLRAHTRQKNLVIKLLGVVLPMILAIFCVYFFFDTEQHILSNRLWLSTQSMADTGSLDLWGLLWILLLNDFCIKFVTMTAKSAILFLPKSALSNHRKGDAYQALERITMFYRSLLPIVPYYYFLLGDADGVWMSGILFIVYIVFKFMNIYEQLLPIYKSILSLINSSSVGTSSTKSDLQAVEVTCSICHDEYSSPVTLGCNHVFCDDCISVWLDNNRTCPMCRSPVLTENPEYRDGTSSMFVQFF